MKKILRIQLLLLLVFSCLSSQTVLAFSFRSRVSTMLSVGPKGAISTAWLPIKTKPKTYEKKESSILWFELSGQYFRDAAAVSQKLEQSGLKHGANKVLLVDMDETLRKPSSSDAEFAAFGYWLPPNKRLLDQIKQALMNEESYVAIVTASLDHPYVLRTFLSKNLPEHHHLIPIVFVAFGSGFNDPKTTSILDDYLLLCREYQKNIHAMMALTIFSPFYPKSDLNVGLVDDVTSILKTFKSKGQEQIAYLNPALPRIREVTTIHPGTFVFKKHGNKLTGGWDSEKAAEMVSEFLKAKSLQE